MKPRTALALVAGCALASPAAGQKSAPVIGPVFYPVTNQHADIRADYSPATGWSLNLDDSDNGVVVPSDQAWVYGPAAARATWPGGAAWSFFSSPGAPVWVLPQTQNVALPYLGTSTEGLPGNYFDSYFNSDPRVNRNGRWIKMQVVAVYGPGDFAVWQTDSFGSPVAWVTTKDGLGASDTLWSLEGGHVHYNWGFTAKGKYAVVFQVSAFKNSQLVASAPALVHFGVEEWWWQFDTNPRRVFR
jgi:surface-anchored protein